MSLPTSGPLAYIALGIAALVVLTGLAVIVGKYFRWADSQNFKRRHGLK